MSDWLFIYFLTCLLVLLVTIRVQYSGPSLYNKQGVFSYAPLDGDNRNINARKDVSPWLKVGAISCTCIVGGKPRRCVITVLHFKKLRPTPPRSYIL